MCVALPHLLRRLSHVYLQLDESNDTDPFVRFHRHPLQPSQRSSQSPSSAPSQTSSTPLPNGQLNNGTPTPQQAPTFLQQFSPQLQQQLAPLQPTNNRPDHHVLFGNFILGFLKARTSII